MNILEEIKTKLVLKLVMNKLGFHTSSIEEFMMILQNCSYLDFSRVYLTRKQKQNILHVLPLTKYNIIFRNFY